MESEDNIYVPKCYDDKINLGVPLNILRDTIAKGKVRLIRGNGWIGQLISLTTLALVSAQTLKGYNFTPQYSGNALSFILLKTVSVIILVCSQWYSIIILGLIITILVGHYDIKYGFLREEQREMNKSNPQLLKILNKIEELKNEARVQK